MAVTLVFDDLFMVGARMAHTNTTQSLRLAVLVLSCVTVAACANFPSLTPKPEPEPVPVQPSEGERALAAAQQNATRLDSLEQQFNAMVDDWMAFRPVISRLSDREEDLNQVILDVANLKAAQTQASRSRRAGAPSGTAETIIPGASAARKADETTSPEKMFSVHLASYRSKDALLEGWAELKQRFPNELLELDGISQSLDLGRDGVYYRLKAGPLKSSSAAAEICEILTRSGAYCVASDFVGDKIS